LIGRPAPENEVGLGNLFPPPPLGFARDSVASRFVAGRVHQCQRQSA
jgi:hypothetical protein